jgi:hypothetical protein
MVRTVCISNKEFIILVSQLMGFNLQCGLLLDACKVVIVCRLNIDLTSTLETGPWRIGFVVEDPQG